MAYLVLPLSSYVGTVRTYKSHVVSIDIQKCVDHSAVLYLFVLSGRSQTESTAAIDRALNSGAWQKLSIGIIMWAYI